MPLCATSTAQPCSARPLCRYSAVLTSSSTISSFMAVNRTSVIERAIIGDHGQAPVGVGAVGSEPSCGLASAVRLVLLLVPVVRAIQVQVHDGRGEQRQHL